VDYVWGEEQVLKFHGHQFAADSICSCCTGDARVVSIDPTGTRPLRTTFNSTLAIKWRGLRVLTRTMIVDQDILSMGSKGLMAIANPSIQGGSTKIQMFQRWFDHIAQAQVLAGDGSWMRTFIERGYNAGQSFAQAQVGAAHVSRYAGDRQEALFQLAVVELQGIIEAVSQQAVRAVAAGILNGQRPSAIVRSVYRVIDRTGVSRSAALVELIVVKAFSEATLDVYEAAGVRKVGLLPERLRAPARVGDAKRKKKLDPSGPGTSRRSRNNPEGPSGRTVQRIRRFERNLERNPLVAVQTAGDDDVCKVCNGISEDGPYKINTARALIPAHPRCRCVFVPE